MRKLLILFLFMAAALPAALLASPTSPAAVPITHGEIIRNDARITFEWPQPVKFTVRATGNQITVTFDRRANPDFGLLLGRLHPYIIRAERKPDQKTVVLTMDKPYKIRTFLTDNISGIDLLDISSGQAAETALLAQLAPAAGEESPPPPATSDVPPPAPAAEAPAVSPAPVAAESPPAGTPAAESPAPAEAEKKPAEEAGDDSHPAPPPPPGKSIKVNISASEDSAVLRLPFSKRVALSVFIRNNTLWLVFNQALPLDLTDFNNLPRTVIGKGELLSATGNTVLRVPIDNTVAASVAKEENSFEWTVLLSYRKRPLINPLKVGVQTEPPAPAHVFIPTLEADEALSVKDPIVGDEMIVVPVYTVGEGIPFTRDFVEFSIPKTAQGIAVVKKADAVSVSSVRGGLRVSTPRGAILTPGLPEMEGKHTTESLQSVATLFPHDSWKPKADSSMRRQIQKLMARVADNADGTQDAANEYRLKIAQMYLSEGLAPEAIGMLDAINRANPVFYRSAKLAALRGAANFLMHRFPDAARDFAASELNNNMEMDFWRTMLSDILGNPSEYNFLALNEDYIRKYPPLFRQRLAIVAADRAIDTKEYNTAIKIFDTLHPDAEGNTENLLKPIGTYVNFLMAKISAETGQEKEGLEMWDKLAVDYKHPFVQARAEFSRIAWAIDHNLIGKEATIDRLERLRTGWHGDSLELKVLGLLGDLYAEKKDYVNAMRIWEGAIQSFPNTAQSFDMARRMEDSFTQMFREGLADSLPTLDALAIYYQYRRYSPSGSAGRQISERLADRLVGVDLLDQAAALLTYQMEHEAEKVPRSQLGTKVALIHLLNRQPQKALEALQNSVYGENPIALRMLRNRLAAQSLSELEQYDKALLLLGQDDSAESERIRINIHWRMKDWPRLISSVEAMLKRREDASKPIDLDESEFLLELALAYIFENDPSQLQYMRDYFGPLMKNNPYKPVFDFITTEDVTPTPTNFEDIIKRLSETRSFIDNYQTRIQTAGLDSVMPQETKTE